MKYPVSNVIDKSNINYSAILDLKYSSIFFVQPLILPIKTKPLIHNIKDSGIYIVK